MVVKVDQREIPCLVIGDVHGHHDRLQALLRQEGIIDEENRRTDKDAEVIQVGDLGQYDRHTHKRDYVTWSMVADYNWVDYVLWGNHDRAVVDVTSSFRGYDPPTPRVVELMEKVNPLMAIMRHGHLITHAGLHPTYMEGKTDPHQAILEGGNIITAISRWRGGYHEAGGILWRDFVERLWHGMPQIFGHTRQNNVERDRNSWCIDIGSIDNGRLAGIWLPEMRAVEIILNQLK